MTQQTPETPESQNPSSDHVHPLERQRRENLAAIAALGAAPYGGRTDGLSTLADARSLYDEAADEAHQASEAVRKQARRDDPDLPEADLPALLDERPRVGVAGRVVLKRDGGKLIWLQLRDHTSAPATAVEGGEDPAEAPAPSPLGGEGRGEGSPPKAEGEPGRLGRLGQLAPDLQVAVSKKDVEAPGFELAKLLDLGDIVVVHGPLMRTKKGEVTVWASSITTAAKSLSPPPEKWSGLQDLEIRYRKRYVDLYANPASMHVALMRARIVQRIRAFLAERGYIEAETPTLQTQAGGAAARPFRTHMNALGIDLYMRIAPELFLKRLLVGGVPRVFEISRNFRNEGLDKQHNPEFTMLELYHAHGDVETVMALTESLIRDAARAVAGPGAAARLPFTEYGVDYEQAFRRVRYHDLFEAALGFPASDEDAVWAAADRHGVLTKYAKHLSAEGAATSPADVRGRVDPIIVVNELFEDVAEPSLDPAAPTFITHYPAALSPLTRPNPDDPSVADRADLFIGHMEIGPHYTELNDPDVQAQRFREQLAGLDDEESTFRTFDADFIEALKVGMPPAGGLGIGIDRICMLLLNQRTIRDVILFPMMRPEA